MYLFNKTVTGFSHIERNKGCEDCSGSFSDESKGINIIAVADGHGDARCFRSAFGSKTAVETALEYLRYFAETNLSTDNGEAFYQSILHDPRYRNNCIRQLTDSILAKWHDTVKSDYESTPPSAEDISAAYPDGEKIKNIAHIYGTTLIAALMLPKCLILIHQGDGRCDVFYDDGSVDQPIPWDKRCEDNSTTSLCDEDAFERFRSCVIDLSERKVIACCMGSDGVEDAYRDTYTDFGGKHTLMGGVNTFYKQLLCSIAEHSPEDFMKYLDEMLPEFSRTGSGDDISVAGIVDTEGVRALENSYKSDIEIYDSEEKLFQKQNDLNSKKRKHGILEKRMNDKANEFVSLQERKRFAEDKIRMLEAAHTALEDEIKKADLEKQQYIAETDIILDKLNNEIAEEHPFGFLSMFKKHCANQASGSRVEITNTRQAYEKKCHDFKSTLDSLIQQRKQVSLELDELGKQIELSTAEFSQAKNDFETYDDQFRAIENDIAEIKAFISSLSATAAESNKSDK